MLCLTICTSLFTIRLKCSAFCLCGWLSVFPNSFTECQVFCMNFQGISNFFILWNLLKWRPHHLSQYNFFSEYSLSTKLKIELKYDINLQVANFLFYKIVYISFFPVSQTIISQSGHKQHICSKSSKGFITICYTIFLRYFHETLSFYIF